MANLRHRIEQLERERTKSTGRRYVILGANDSWAMSGERGQEARQGYGTLELLPTDYVIRVVGIDIVKDL